MAGGNVLEVVGKAHLVMENNVQAQVQVKKVNAEANNALWAYF